MKRFFQALIALGLFGLTQCITAAPPQDSAEHWIDEGARLRGQSEWVAAQAAYEHASTLNGAALDSRLWELRCWLEQGRINDALDQIDALARTKAASPAELDYLYGMAFVRKAEDYVAQGETGSGVAMNFSDAVEHLDRATRSDPERFADAYAHLAQAAYNSQRNELARASAERAVQLFPESTDALLLLGRIALSQFVVANGDGSPAEVANDHWSAAEASFRKGVERVAGALDPETPDYASETLLARFQLQLGYTYGWKPERASDAAAAFGRAMEWDPTAVDYPQVWNIVGLEPFLETASAAAEAFAARAVADDARDATLLWFLGRARFDAEDWAGTESAFTAAVTKWPAYADSWFYIGRARYSLGDYAGATAAFRKHWEAAPDDLIASVRSDEELNVAIFDWLVGQAVVDGNNLDAAFLSEVCAEAVLLEPRYWNNLGLFLRDEGERLIAEEDGGDAQVRTDLFERSYVAYGRALDLNPGDPALLNDTALLLHYHLDRDLDHAREMYVRAHERAVEELARDDLSEDLRSLYEIAERDSKNNLALLDEELAGS